MPSAVPFRALVLLLCCGPAAAATFNVSKTSDTFDGVCNSDCSLRDAVHAANASPGTDTIVLKGTTYKLTRVTPLPPEQDDNVTVDEDENHTGDFDVSDDTIFTGVAGVTAIDAGLLSRVFEVLPGNLVEFRDLEIRRGYERERGAGIFNAGTLRLNRVRMRLNNAASSFNLGQGGALANVGTATVNDSQLRDNQAAGGEASAGEGAAIWNSGRLIVRRSSFTGNKTRDDNDLGGGGAIMNRGGTVTIDRAFFQGNATGQNGHGGAIANRDGGSLSMVNATVSGNTSGEPVVGGGAIANGTWQGEAGSLYLNFVTVADNDGGGVFNAGDLIYYDSIIAGNFENFGSFERHYSAGVNCNSLTFPIAAGSIVSLDGDGCRGQTYVDNATVLSTVLHPLANNGGFAPTHALRDFDLAHDAASLGGGACPPTDQRGAKRPFDADGDGYALCDIGAWERNADD